MESLHMQHTPDTSQNKQESSNPLLESLLHTIDKGGTRISSQTKSKLICRRGKRTYATQTHYTC
jgi:hypothetical protein